MAVGAICGCGGRNMRLLADIWENQEAEIEQNMDQNYKHWNLLPIEHGLISPRDSTTSRSCIIH